jgi:hypothetical protein
MFARKVTFEIKPSAIPELTQKFEKDVLPLLRKQQGFVDHITLVAPEGRKAFGIMLWDTKENAEKFHRAIYPEVAKILSKISERAPEIETYDVAFSTFHTHI